MVAAPLTRPALVAIFIILVGVGGGNNRIFV